MGWGGFRPTTTTLSKSVPRQIGFPRFVGTEPLKLVYLTICCPLVSNASEDTSSTRLEFFGKSNRKEHCIGPLNFDCPPLGARHNFSNSTRNQYSAAEYYNQFTVLANRVEGLSDAALLDYFLSGLKEPLRREVIAQTPNSLHKAGSLARLFDEKNSLGFVTKHKTTGSSSYFKSPTNLPLPPIKKLSPAEMQLRREKGLCFTCDETYTWNHKCPNKQYMVLLTSNDDVVLSSD
ncbi:hypothetical protein Tco_0636707 [Tanacetum coccineum]